ncbi:hypothetical protein VMCG_05174 [Cytospora schulzeri]|uniref:Uncharacterized protein n=1 Tax=Cytospora schulzeri TaxID=448051 RepID=A0A423WQN7_9PEZI|nr:hypothetical protein VMCG_05174 [Valsa malicola]
MSNQIPAAPDPARLQKVDSIIKTWTSFKGIYKEKRYIIENRWMKLKNDRKKQLLGDCWQGMPADHRPDLNGPAVWRLKGQKAMVMPWPLPSEPELAHMLMPEYNKDDLGNNDVALLQVLESRADHHPGEFGQLDVRDHYACRLLECFGHAIEYPTGWEEKLKGMLVAYVGPPAEDRPEDFGATCQIEGPEHFRTLLNADYMVIEQAKQMVDNQEKIYGFLERLCINITDHSRRRALSVKGENNPTAWRRTPIFDPQGAVQIEISRLYLKDCSNLVPYSTPYDIDWEYVSVLSGFQLRHAQNRLRKIKEDPEAFFLSLVELRDHSAEGLFFYPSKKRHAWFNVENNTVAWTAAFTGVLGDMAYYCDFWQGIFDHTEKARQIVQESKLTQRELSRGYGPYRAHVLAIMRQLAYSGRIFISSLPQIKCSPSMRGLYTVDEDNFAMHQGLGTRKPANDNERTVIAMVNALENKDSTAAFGVWTIVEEMFRRIQRPWMSDYIVDHLEQYHIHWLILHLILRALDSQRHDFTEEDLVDDLPCVDRLERLLKVSCQSGSDMERIFHRLMMTTDSSGSRLVSLRNKFRYTKKNKMSKAERKNAIDAENNLRQLWEEAEKVLGESGENVLSDDVKAVLADVEPLVTNPDSGAARSAAPARPASAQSSEVPFVPIAAAQPSHLVARKVPRTLLAMQSEARKRVISVNGITEIAGLHEPHQANMPTMMARDWARNRSHGLAKYGWDFDHFVEGDQAPE